jgi:hypothetical protein
MRSLKTDSFRASRIGLILASLLMLALVFWFFSARVALYETSSDLSGSQDGRVLVTFKEEALGRIQQGQTALLRLGGSTSQRSQPVTAMVFDVDREMNQVELLILEGDLPADILSGKLTGQVEIEVERITPAELVLRTSGKYLSNNNVQLSPQTTSGTQSP